MEHYINKDTVMTEIESLKRTTFTNFDEGVNCAAQTILETIDALEVKEVDLEKEFDNYAKDILACDVQFEPFTHLYNCAKHFYELGMAARNKAQKGK